MSQSRFDLDDSRFPPARGRTDRPHRSAGEEFRRAMVSGGGRVSRFGPPRTFPGRVARVVFEKGWMAPLLLAVLLALPLLARLMGVD